MGGLSGGQFVQFEALVDTGSSDTVLPRDILERLGITVVDRFAYSLPDETIVEYDIGEARVRLDGRERTTQVVFGPVGVTPLLGATTLQLFHLGVDPLQEQLVPVTGLLKPLRPGVKDRKDWWQRSSAVERALHKRQATHGYRLWPSEAPGPS